MRTVLKTGAWALVAASIAWTTVPDAATAVSVPLNCSRGPSGQRCELLVTVPVSVEAGATFKVRFDGKNSGRISHTGLNYIHHMTTEVLVPANASYVEGSARVKGTRDGGMIIQTVGAHEGDQGAFGRFVN